MHLLLITYELNLSCYKKHTALHFRFFPLVSSTIDKGKKSPTEEDSPKSGNTDQDVNGSNPAGHRKTVMGKQ